MAEDANEAFSNFPDVSQSEVSENMCAGLFTQELSHPDEESYLAKANDKHSYDSSSKSSSKSSENHQSNIKSSSSEESSSSSSKSHQDGNLKPNENITIETTQKDQLTTNSIDNSQLSNDFSSYNSRDYTNNNANNECDSESETTDNANNIHNSVNESDHGTDNENDNENNSENAGKEIDNSSQSVVIVKTCKVAKKNNDRDIGSIEENQITAKEVRQTKTTFSRIKKNKNNPRKPKDNWTMTQMYPRLKKVVSIIVNISYVS